MIYFIQADELPKSTVSITEVLKKWDEYDDSTIIAYKTKNGNWAILISKSDDEEAKQTYGFCYLSKLLTGKPSLMNLTFKGDTPKKALEEVLKSKRELFYFPTMHEFLEAV